MKDLKNGLRLAYFLTSAIIGAGFISGKEIINHFALWGANGFYGIILASLVMSVTGTSLMLLTLKHKSKYYSEYIKEVFGKYIGFFVKAVSFVFMLVIFSAMVSGAGEILNEIFPFGSVIARIVFLFLCFVSVIKRPFFICRISSVLCPIMIIGIIYVCCTLITDMPQLYKFRSDSSADNHFIFSALCWCSYNIITLPSVIFGIKSAVTSKKASLIGGITSSILIFICMIFLYFTETLFLGRIYKSPLPIAALCSLTSKHTQYIYMLLFIFAIFTTALSLLNALSKEISHIFITDIKTSLIFLCFLGFVLSFFGFSQIVGTFYKTFGIIGFIIPIFIIFSFIKEALIILKKGISKNSRM